MNKTTNMRALPKSVWAMGFASLFMDMSSELVHSLLPIFMLTTLGASMVTIGLLEGIAEATSAVAKVFSGALSDYLRKRKALMVFGYALAALTKPIFPLAQSITWVFTARFIDRLGKGIRGAPRDALIAEVTHETQRGSAYGLRQSLDSIGALLGPALAVLLMIYFANNIRIALWFAVVPAIITVILLIVFVREPATNTPARKAAPNRKLKNTGLSLAKIGFLPKSFWIVSAIGSVLTLARFSEAFLILRAEDIGLTLAYVPIILIVMNAFYAAAAYPSGAAADRFDATTLLAIGSILLIAADVVLALASNALAVFAGAALWGLHMAFTQGILAKFVADTAPAGLLGTAFGVFNLITGFALLLASLIAGLLWTHYGASATFLAGVGFAVIATIGLLIIKPTN